MENKTVIKNNLSMRNESRRRFLASTGLASVAVSSVAKGASSRAKDLFVHHVYFWLKNPDSEQERAKLQEGLNQLAKVPTIKLVHIGMPAATNRSVIEKGYAFSWLCFFDTAADEEVYQKHPIHLEFIENYSHLWEKVIVYDSVGPRR
jgi:hypothetical protein